MRSSSLTVAQPNTSQDEGEDRLCARTACRGPGAAYYNIGSDDYYCLPCARKINEAGAGQLCHKSREAAQVWQKESPRLIVGGDPVAHVCPECLVQRSGLFPTDHFPGCSLWAEVEAELAAAQ